MTKRILCVILVLTLVMGVFTACGGNEKPDAEVDENGVPVVSLEEIWAANATDIILEKYDSVVYELTSSDAEGGDDFLTTLSYSREDGPTEFFYNVYSGDKDNMVSTLCAYQGEGMPAAMYSSFENIEFLNIIPSWDYETVVLKYNGFTAFLRPPIGEEIYDRSFQDDALIVQSKIEYDNGMYDDILYYVWPDSLELIYYENNSYDENGECLSTSTARAYYDEELEFDNTAQNAVLSGGETNLKVVFNPGMENEEIQEFAVNEDVEEITINAHAEAVYAVYSDEALENRVDIITLSEETATYYVVFEKEK